MFTMLSFVGCTRYPEDYTLEEHIKNITKKVQKRYIDSGRYEFDSFEVYPIYDQDDKLSYFLVEFEPQGFLFIHLGVQRFISYFFAVPGMYMYDDQFLDWFWVRYRQAIDGIEPEPYNGHEWVYYDLDPFSSLNINKNTRFEADEDCQPIKYYKSPYYISGELNNKLYYLELPNGGIPAVKKDDTYINLVSMESFIYLGKDEYSEESMPPNIFFHFVYSDKL